MSIMFTVMQCRTLSIMLQLQVKRWSVLLLCTITTSTSSWIYDLRFHSGVTVSLLFFGLHSAASKLRGFCVRHNLYLCTTTNLVGYLEPYVYYIHIWCICFKILHVYWIWSIKSWYVWLQKEPRYFWDTIARMDVYDFKTNVQM